MRENTSGRWVKVRGEGSHLRVDKNTKYKIWLPIWRVFSNGKIDPFLILLFEKKVSVYRVFQRYLHAGGNHQLNKNLTNTSMHAN